MPPATRPNDRPVLGLALALSLAATVSLGVTRFAYGLLLPTMRADLQWSYTLAGAMNTANALGYLVGALLSPVVLRQVDVSRLLVAGSLFASLFMGLSGFFTEALPLLLQRALAGLASAFLLVAGSLLASRLVALRPERGGLLLGVYYGGTGVGIVLSAWLVPVLLEAAQLRPHGWAWAWWGLALVCLAATTVLVWPARALQRMEQGTAAPAAVPSAGLRWTRFAPALAAYCLFGVGYIGYMTFVIALLREQGEGPGGITAFYALLGLAILNAWLALATLLPALTSAWPFVLLSGIVFGGVFLSVVASTTALAGSPTGLAEWRAAWFFRPWPWGWAP
jgi:MFS family permease